MNLFFSFLTGFMGIGIFLGFFLRLRYLGNLVFNAWVPLVTSFERKWAALRELRSLMEDRDHSFHDHREEGDGYAVYKGKITPQSICRKPSILKKIWDKNDYLEQQHSSVYSMIDTFEPKTREERDLFMQLMENLWAAENKISFHIYAYSEAVETYYDLFGRMAFASVLRFFGWGALLPLPFSTTEQS